VSSKQKQVCQRLYDRIIATWSALGCRLYERTCILAAGSETERQGCI
jgi:hypothetical protein